MLVVYLGLEITAHRPIWMVPVAEAIPVVPRVAAKVNDDAHEQEPDERHDLETAKPELQFAEHSYTEQIDRKDCGGISGRQMPLRRLKLTERDEDD